MLHYLFPSCSVRRRRTNDPNVLVGRRLTGLGGTEMDDIVSGATRIERSSGSCPLRGEFSRSYSFRDFGLKMVFVPAPIEIPRRRRCASPHHGGIHPDSTDGFRSAQGPLYDHRLDEKIQGHHGPHVPAGKVRNCHGVFEPFKLMNRRSKCLSCF